ncbi:primosomal replication protein N [Bordetella genomosp. 13]|uniref:Replication restart protein PriB n=1 Tax=Bordetella genomosp. 13 TaxID=463040 RepID=A0A1W6ZE10_9BORD|nr:primosomal replication protein N [Bordetella genomosp. 13]ARP95613.1 primosomal replication protein N [Bordetella genomosp. 13]
MNTVELDARVIEREPLRHTPGGLPAIEMLLSHESDVVEAGHPRRVSLTIAAVALGDLAMLLADIPLGTDLRIQGFLAPVRKDSVKLRLHMQRAGRIGGSAGGDPPVA